MVDRRRTLTRINDQIRTVVTRTLRVCEKLYTLVISELCQHTAIPTMARSLLPNGLRECIRFPLLRTHGSSPLIEQHRQSLRRKSLSCSQPLSGGLSPRTSSVLRRVSCGRGVRNRYCSAPVSSYNQR